MIYYTIFLLFLVQSSMANFEDSLADNSELYSEEFLDPDENGEVDKRDNHFMRFGRNKDFGYEEYDDNSLSKRSGNHHVRFGRSGPSSFMRFGRDQSRGRNKSIFMRIGRNFQDQDDKIRSKRSAPQNPPDPGYPKRKDHFMRFGKSPSFMRYGRNMPQNEEETGINDYSHQLLSQDGNYEKENHLISLLLDKLINRREKLLEDSV